MRPAGPRTTGGRARRGLFSTREPPTGEKSCLDQNRSQFPSTSGPTAATTADRATWIVHADAVFVQRFLDARGQWQTFVLHAADHDLATGDRVRIESGKIASIERKEGK